MTQHDRVHGKSLTVLLLGQTIRPGDSNSIYAADLAGVLIRRSVFFVHIFLKL